MRGTRLQRRALSVALAAITSFSSAMLSQAIQDHMGLPPPAAVIHCWPASCPSDQSVIQLQHQALAAEQRAREITTSTPHLSAGPTPSPTPPPAPPVNVGGGGPLSPDQVGQYWLAAGGSPAAEQTAECIAWHESGDNPDAISPTSDVGLWQINTSHAGGRSWTQFVSWMEDPAANAAEAVQLSGNGTDWAPWTTAPDCGV